MALATASRAFAFVRLEDSATHLKLAEVSGFRNWEIFLWIEREYGKRNYLPDYIYLIT